MEIQKICCIVVTILIAMALIMKLIKQYLTEQGKIRIKDNKIRRKYR